VTGAELPRTGAPGATNLLAALGALLVAAGALVVLCCRPLRRSIRARPRAG
jgi:LPXTG-motif cell wall-anchored protein